MTKTGKWSESWANTAAQSWARLRQEEADLKREFPVNTSSKIASQSWILANSCWWELFVFVYCIAMYSVLCIPNMLNKLHPQSSGKQVMFTHFWAYKSIRNRNVTVMQHLIGWCFWFCLFFFLPLMSALHFKISKIMLSPGQTAPNWQTQCGQKPFFKDPLPCCLTGKTISLPRKTLWRSSRHWGKPEAQQAQTEWAL